MIYATPVKVRKRPVVVHAMRFEGGAASAAPIVDWITACDGTASWHEAHDAWEYEDGTEGYPARSEGIEIHTLEGTITASVGDWVIQGVRGEFYPCKPDIFTETYEVIS